MFLQDTNVSNTVVVSHTTSGTISTNDSGIIMSSETSTSTSSGPSFNRSNSLHDIRSIADKSKSSCSLNSIPINTEGKIHDVELNVFNHSEESVTSCQDFISTIQDYRVRNFNGDIQNLGHHFSEDLVSIHSDDKFNVVNGSMSSSELDINREVRN